MLEYLFVTTYKEGRKVTYDSTHWGMLVDKGEYTLRMYSLWCSRVITLEVFLAWDRNNPLWVTYKGEHNRTLTGRIINLNKKEVMGGQCTIKVCNRDVLKEVFL